jgi:hypothetical protein
MVAHLIKPRTSVNLYQTTWLQALMALMNLWPISGLSVEMCKCLHKDTTTKILQNASELLYVIDRKKKEAISVLPVGARPKVHISRLKFKHQNRVTSNSIPDMSR